MESYQNQYGAVEQTRTDAYGNPVPVSTDEYGNPIATKEQHGHTLGGMLHRSGSSSSSSSEDDGYGGRRKKEKGKGMKEKIKEKLPGHHNKPDHATSTTVPGGYNSSATTHHDQEHKGIMDKIKDKLPGTHRNH